MNYDDDDLYDAFGFAPAADEPPMTRADLDLIYQWELAHEERLVCAQCKSAFGPPGVLPGMRDEPYCGRACRRAAKLEGRNAPPRQKVPAIRPDPEAVAADEEDALIAATGRRPTGELLTHTSSEALHRGAVVRLPAGREGVVLSGAPGGYEVMVLE